MTLPGSRISWMAHLVAVLCVVFASPAKAQSDGGLYIAGAGFSFQVAAERAIAQNPGAGRFFLLALPPQAAALTTRASAAQSRLREQVVAANGVLMVCQRDIDNRKIRADSLVPGVRAVRGWPAKGSPQMPDGQRYFADENPADLPASNEALRRMRSACA